MQKQLISHRDNDKLDFYFMINPYFPTKDMIAKLNSNMENLLKFYPSSQKVISEKIKKIENIGVPLVALNGSCEGIKIFMQNFTRLSLVTVPNFNEYEISNHVTIPYDATAEEIKIEIKRHKVDSVIFCNPNNPTGYYREDIEKLASEFKDIKFIIDVSFWDFIGINIPILPKGKNIVLIKSLGKIYGLCGIRIGYIASEDKQLMKAVEDKIPIWNVNSVAEAMIDLILSHKEEYESSRKKIVRDTKKMYEFLKKFDFLTVYPTKANFVMVRSKKPLNFNVKCCDNKTGLDKTFYRIAYNNNYEELKKLMEEK